MLGILAILLTLFALMYFAYRGVTVLILAPLLAMLAALLSGELPFLSALSNHFMPAAAKYIKAYFPVFLAGAIFGKLMGVTGAATRISHFIAKKVGKSKAIASIVIATALLTYGGVSLFVVVFAIYPIGAMLLKEANLPKRLLPASIALGAFTFTMTAMPGSPQYINTMPTIKFGTTIYAAPILGLLGSALMLGLGLFWLNRRSKKLVLAGEGYGTHKNEGLHELNENLPKIGIAVLPIIIVFILNFVLTNWFFKLPSIVESFKNSGSKINGTWPVIIALGIAIAVIILTQKKFLAKKTNKHVFDGAVGSLLPIFNTASEVGYGGVIKSLAAFTSVKLGMLALSIPSIFKVAISTTLLAGIVGSSSGGTAIALEVLGDQFLAMGLHPEAIHRIMIMAAGGLDTLPHCGAVITLFAVCKLNHKQSYFDLAAMTVVIPLIVTLFVCIFHLVTGLV